MSPKGNQICQIFLILGIMSLTWSETKAQSSNCNSALMTMTTCLNYITGNSSTPDSTCCSALANVVQSQPQCLCAALNSNAASSLGVAINQTRAAELPKSCKVQTPPLSKCNESGSTSNAPTDSSTGKPDEHPEVPSTDLPSGSGSKTIPVGSTSHGTIVKSSLRFLATVISCTSALAIF